ncbi:MAG: BsuPI-related putative proteinase inhibitor [Verrucomicrobiae bacterium]|nr:BsuPI-related putative proteinase inhibitor [Verrucomicrobiae bacterium]
MNIRKHFWQRASIGGILLAGLVLAISVLGIEISASKPQGGTTNAQPYQSSKSQPSLLSAPFKWLFGEGRSDAMTRVKAPPNFKVQLLMEPKVFTETNAYLRAKMVATNQGKDRFLLEFPTAQHFDFVIINQAGNEVFRWSADKEFESRVSTTLVNKNEKISYSQDIFSGTNKVVNLAPGEYKVRGEITAKTPFMVETTFRIQP